MWESEMRPVEMPSATSLSLLDRARDREPAAWQRLLHLYAPLVWLWCKRAGLQPADVDDIAQEVFAAVANNLAGFRHDRPGSTFRGWLRTITINKVRDRQRLRRTERARLAERDPIEPPDDSTSAPAPLDEESLVVREAIELLRHEYEERTWRAFWQTVVEGRSPRDVAGDLRMSLNAVYLARSRILRRLRVEFDGLILV
jgi:RNA polymerase sigma-70 factor (ECF subfamily)